MPWRLRVGGHGFTNRKACSATLAAMSKPKGQGEWENMTTPRIDSLRRQLAATVDLLGLLEVELDDLHTLAYDRAVLMQERTNGGTHDYALDTHGDPAARDAYRALGEACDQVCKDLTEATHTAVSLLRVGGLPASKGGRRVRAVELAAAIAARARRIQRGEYVPRRHVYQPDTDVAVLGAQRDLERVEAENRGLVRQVQRLQRALNERRTVVRRTG